MTTKINSGKPPSAKSASLRMVLQKRAASSNGQYVELSTRKRELTKKVERLRDESRGSMVQVAEG